jgi:thiol-disulfide isomerase/thioredoxin
MYRRILTLAAAACCTSGALAQTPPANTDAPAAKAPAARKQPTLKVGDPAPALKVEKWVKGEPVTEFQQGKVYVIEYWATWCGPCRAAMPHNSEVQKKFKDKGVTVIGMTSVDPNNSLEAVEKMVKDKGDVMSYTVAWDSERKTNEAYMKAAGQNGIPCAFVVDKQSKIAWIGHPMQMDKPLEKIVEGKWDAAAEAKKAEELEAKSKPVMMAFSKAARAQEWDAAVKACDEMIALDPEANKGWALRKFDILLNQKKDYDAAYGWGRQVVTGAAKDDAMGLNQIAWTILDTEGLEKRDLDLAMSAATRADELTKHADAAIIDTLARAYFEKGNATKAVELQKKAIERADAEMKPDMEAALEKYKAKASETK